MHQFWSIIQEKETGVSVANEIAEYLDAGISITENDYKNGIKCLIDQFNDKYPLDAEYLSLCFELISFVI